MNPPSEHLGLALALSAFTCIGHAYLWTGLLNHLYGRPLPKWFLKPWRTFTGFVILGMPMLMIVGALDSNRASGLHDVFRHSIVEGY